LTLVKKLKGVQGVILDQLSPRVVTVQDEDGSTREELELKVKPKSFEGMARALKDIVELQGTVMSTGLELIAGSRGDFKGSSDTNGQGKDDGDASALGRLKRLAKLREVANMLAVQDGTSGRSE
jgi:hypothetical protein